MSFEAHYDGHCPECRLRHDREERLWLNHGDFFECPECRLMVSVRCPPQMAILRRRGNGHLRDRTNPHHGAPATGLYSGGDWYGEDPARHGWPNGDCPLDSEPKLRQYLLTEIVGVDPLV